MNVREILQRHKEYQNKTMEQLVEERHRELLRGQNELRKKWLPELYDPSLEQEHSYSDEGTA